jgi:hypothetical protein
VKYDNGTSDDVAPRNLKIMEIVHLKQEIRGCQLLHQRAREQIQDLRMTVAHRCMQPDPLDIAADRTWADLLYNCDVHPTRHRYSVESLISGREIHDISAAAYQVISQIFRIIRIQVSEQNASSSECNARFDRAG